MIGEIVLQQVQKSKGDRSVAGDIEDTKSLSIQIEKGGGLHQPSNESLVTISNRICAIGTFDLLVNAELQQGETNLLSTNPRRPVSKRPR